MPHVTAKVYDVTAELEAVRICEDHGKDLSLYCKEPGCDKHVCTSCLNAQHRKHDVIEVGQGSWEELVLKTQEVEEQLEEKITRANQAKDEVSSKTAACIEKLKEDKEEMKNKFKEMIEEAEEMEKESSKEIEQNIFKFNTFLDEVRSLKSTGREVSNREASRKLERVRRVEELVGRDQDEEDYYHPEYQQHGAVMKRELKREPLDDDVTDDVTEITHASELDIEVGPRKDTKLRYIYHVAVSDDRTAFLCGKEEDKWCHLLKRISLPSGGESGSVELKFLPAGLAVVELGGKEMLAVTVPDSDNKRIEFRDPESLKTIRYIDQVAPRVPLNVVFSPPSTLLYVDGSRSPREVRVLECSGAEPVEVGVVKTQLDHIEDMCVVKRGSKKRLLVCVGGGSTGKIHAYNIKTQRLRWRVEGRADGRGDGMLGVEEALWPQGVTTDGRGRLFVTDRRNNSVEVFHVPDGRYLGFLEVNEHVTGNPRHVGWSRPDDSLVVSMGRKNTRFVQVIKFLQ